MALILLNLAGGDCVAAARIVVEPSFPRRQTFAIWPHSMIPTRRRNVSPPINENMKAWWQVNQELDAYVQRRSPQSPATLDLDTTLVGSEKNQILWYY